MEKINGLLSFRGRASRLDYWRWFLLSSVLSGLLFAVSAFVALTEAPGSKILAGGLLLGIVMLLWPAVAVGVRRLHDRNRPWWWIAVFGLLPFSLDVVAMNGFPPSLAIIQPLLMLAGLAVSVWGLVDMGFLRGTRGPNRFGPEPSRR